MSRRAAFLILVVWLAVGLRLQAITIRDDVTDAASQALATQSDFASVGKLSRISDGDLTTGVLIGSRYVLTAAHVIGGAAQNGFQFTIGGVAYQSVSYAVNSGYDGDSSKGFDLAIIELAAQVPSIVPAVLYTGSAEVGVQATLVGFGQGGNGTSGGSGARGTERAATNKIDATSYSSYTSGRLLFFDFDTPAGGFSDNAIGSSAATTDEGMVAFGDSGGALFGTIGGTSYLLGIHSFVLGDADGINYNYGDLGASTRVSSNSPFIATTIPEPRAGVFFVAGLAMLGMVSFQKNKTTTLLSTQSR